MRRLMIWGLCLVFLLAACGKDDNESATPGPNLTPIPTEEPFAAPDFTLLALDGTSYTLSELQGQWVLINFWATWCKPCVEEMPTLQTMSDNLLVLGVNVREDRAKIQTFLTENNITYPILLTPNDAVGNQVLLDYQSTSLPQTLLVNPQGEVVWRQFGPLDLATFSTQLNSFITTES